MNTFYTDDNDDDDLDEVEIDLSNLDPNSLLLNHQNHQHDTYNFSSRLTDLTNVLQVFFQI
jgi:hypothetical protein